ncbi:cytochrome oxidase small assembly protein [Comamonas guangdongensis]|uniref:Cytochrome oxidase small assembly protein n=1 Tax=Comamonas guangdongensis TaxID=510515 RepID=A0ABV3ZWA5_9BURK
MSMQEQRRANRRLGLILASTALVFFIGFMVKMAWLH